MSGVEGWTDPRFDRLIEAFQSNVSVGEESDAQLAVVVDGVLVADLSTAGSSQALYPVFSVSKAITASVLLTAQRNGHIDPDAPVARYWPEFAAAGKGEITVRQVAAHRAGLPAFDLPMGAGDLLDWNRCARLCELALSTGSDALETKQGSLSAADGALEAIESTELPDGGT
ncbi:MAG: beta-lactamase family protein, partial [Microbacteriaceae bacterium]|nr:beta-lactamase family protein [Microbacteriaceae bacterium]